MQIINLKDHPHMIRQASLWFHEKWQIPASAYESSMQESLTQTIPSWYVMIHNDIIIAGIGIIENDFHKRIDLTPNICALYVKEEYRHQGIAGKLLQHVCDDMKDVGIDTLYLITDLTSFYEKYNWKFLCMVEDDDGLFTRMYVHYMNKML